MTGATANGLQGVLGLIGITFGVIPVGQFLVFGQTGSVWRLMLADATGTLAWVAPVVTAIVAVLLIVVVERRKTD